MAARRSKKNEDTTLTVIDFDDKALANYGDEFQSAIDMQQASTPASSGMPRIKASNGGILLPGAVAAVPEIDAVILCGLRRNAYWEGAYTPGQSEPPVCGAIANLGDPETKMVPDEEWPKVQAASCRECPQNIGPSKACRNGLQLALVSLDDIRTVADAQEATIFALQISATGIAPFGRTVAILSGKRVPIFGAVCRIESVKLAEANTYYTTVATPTGAISPQIAKVLGDRQKEAADLLVAGARPAPVLFEGEGTEESADTGRRPPARRRTSKAKKTSSKRRSA